MAKIHDLDAGQAGEAVFSSPYSPSQLQRLAVFRIPPVRISRSS